MGIVVLCVAALAPVSNASEMGEAAANQVSLASYQVLLDDWLYTHAGDDRGYGPEHDLARNNIAYLFGTYGFTVTLEPFSYGGTYYNVVAEKLGTTYPDQIYVVGAHFDSVNNPGADDDASGVALLLEAARILGSYDSDYTIRFIAFDREEQGLIGSTAYVNNHDDEDIRGMVQADMVAYDPGTNHARIYGRTTSNPIKTALGTAITSYSGGLSWGDYGWISASDHAPFDAAGFQACLLIEGEVWNNPYYHTQQDNVDNPANINYGYAVKMTRSVVGFLVDQAGVEVPVDALDFEYPDGLPEYASPAGGTRVRVVVTGLGTEVPDPGTGLLHYNVGAGWQTEAMEVVAPSVYDAVLPGSACGEQVRFYFSAESLTGQTYSDPWDAPANSHAATAAYGVTVALEETFDSAPAGWVGQPQWAFGQPLGGGGEYGGPDPTSGHTGSKVYGYNLAGDYANYLPETHLTSAAIDCTGLVNTHLVFWRWLGVEQPTYDHAYVRVSTNGTTWTTIWQNASEIADTSWHLMDLDISALADDRPVVYLRWTMGATDSSWRYCGWNLDDVQLVASNCAPLADGDHDGDGDVDLLDAAELQVCYSGSANDYPDGLGCESFDFDADLDVDPPDYAAFYSRFEGP